ncbi:hypothetical protein [Asticcacaulis solisilvae]
MKRQKDTRPVPASFFAERRQRADFATFERIMTRKGGQPPVAGDEIGD